MVSRGRNVVIVGFISQDNNALCKGQRDCHLVSTTCWVWKVGAQGDKGITWKLYRENFWSFYPIQTEFDMSTRWECGWCQLSSIEKKMQLEI